MVISFLFVLGIKGRMQPVVMAPKNLSTPPNTKTNLKVQREGIDKRRRTRANTL